jgi:outer membrane immunogenic protein
MIRRLLLSTALAALATASLAADLPSIKGPAPFVTPPAFTWTGFHIGVIAGYEQGDKIRFSGDPVNIFNDFNTGVAPNTIQSRSRGFTGGLEAGYDYQINRLVVGVEGDVSFAGIKRSNDVVVAGLGVPRFLHADDKLNWLGSLRGRIGFLPTDRVLAYLTGGLAFGQGSASINFTTTVPNNMAACVTANIGVCVAASNSRTSAGWVLGGGVEVALTNNWSIKGEYLHYSLGTIKLAAVDTRFGLPQPTLFGKFRLQADVFRAGINYKF